MNAKGSFNDAKAFPVNQNNSIDSDVPKVDNIVL